MLSQSSHRPSPGPAAGPDAGDLGCRVVLQRQQQDQNPAIIHWVLRVGIFLEFAGHGVCGLHAKAAWLPYFRVFAIPDAVSLQLMPLIGSLDVFLALWALLSPRRSLLLYMAVWGCFTALLRPAAGEGTWEFIERSYNWGVAASLLVLHGGGRGWKSWFVPLRSDSVPHLAAGGADRLRLILRWTVAMMLIGHGGFGAFMAKSNLLGFYRGAGLEALGVPLTTLRTEIGVIEMVLGAMALFVPQRAFFGFVFFWKLGTELLYPLSGAPLGCWEFVERGASYAAPLALLCLLSPGAATNPAGPEASAEAFCEAPAEDHPTPTGSL